MANKNSHVVKQIRKLCERKNITISHLEAELGFSRGSIVKAGVISPKRLQKIADYFGVNMEYLVAELPSQNTSNNDAVRIEEQNRLLMEICKVQERINSYYAKIDKCHDKIRELKATLVIYENLIKIHNESYGEEDDGT